MRVPIDTARFQVCLSLGSELELECSRILELATTHAVARQQTANLAKAQPRRKLKKP